MIYKCHYCKFEAYKKISYDKHLLTQKHINKCNQQTNTVKITSKDTQTALIFTLKDNLNNNIEPDDKKHECQYCFDTYDKKYDLYKHLQVCEAKKINDMNEQIKLKYELQIDKLKYESQIDKLKIEMLEKQAEKTAENEQFHKKVIECGNNNVDKLIETNMRALTFLNTFYDKGPCLENFNVNFKDPYLFYKDTFNPNMLYDGENYIINGKKIPKDEYIIDLIIHIFNINDDIKYYVNKIIEYYKNDKFPDLQAMWSSDSYRINYNVRIKVSDTVSKWHVDKSGLIATEKILDPMFEFTCNILRKGLLTFKKEMDECENNVDDMMPYVRKMASLSGFINKIEKKELQPEIMKLLASHFFLDTNKHKLLLDAKDKKSRKKKVK